ncbi:MAG: S41 family peptidase [Spirochaetales bacterium]|nr:S41 family peptidase [Spirochaetales bacterium]
MTKKIIIIFLICFSIGNKISAQNQKMNPIYNFEKLWSEFNDRYANFELKAVDWTEIYNKYRPLVTLKTTNDELFDICSNMLSELKDGHVSLIQYSKDKSVLKESDKPYPVYLQKEFPNVSQLLSLIDTTLTNNNFPNPRTVRAKDASAIKYCKSDKYGYLSMNGMFDNYKAANLAIDEFIELDGIIIDLRFNGGGRDVISYKIAGRFTDEKRVGHYKKTRIKGTDEFTKLETWYLKPLGKNQFTKPIVLLTSDLTASAAEIFVIAMKELPNVTVIGDKTQGILSDKFVFNLPNDWVVSLSHQQYFSSTMINYEEIGIEPDYKIINSQEDIIRKSDPIIEKAIEILNSK